jgi:hypothetical protein
VSRRALRVARGPVAGVGCARHCASVHRLKADTTCTYAA